MIGLFAMSQAFETIEDIYSTDEIDASVTRLLPTKEDVKTILRVAPVTGLIGTMIGIILVPVRYRILCWIQHCPRHVQTSGTVR